MHNAYDNARRDRLVIREIDDGWGRVLNELRRQLRTPRLHFHSACYGVMLKIVPFPDVPPVTVDEYNEPPSCARP